jgi:hypothetical protein
MWWDILQIISGRRVGSRGLLAESFRTAECHCGNQRTFTVSPGLYDHSQKGMIFSRIGRTCPIENDSTARHAIQGSRARKNRAGNQSLPTAARLPNSPQECKLFQSVAMLPTATLRPSQHAV